MYNFNFNNYNSKNENDNKNIIYEDMKELFDNANLYSSNIGIFSKVDNNGNISYGECGSGVIFKSDNNTYYALTAAHVVSTENAELLVFTTNTDMKSESIPGISEVNVLSQDVYDSMYSAKIEYVSQRDDLAIISFESKEELSIIEINDNDPKIGDRIMCIGNPENDWFAFSYGKVTSGIESFGELKGYSSNAMKHSTCIQVGSSGGAALSLNGKDFKYGVLIPVSEIKICLNEWSQN